MNSQMQPSGLQNAVTSMQPTSVTSMLSSMPPLPTHTGISTALANMMNPLQTGAGLESGQGSGPNPLQTGVGSLQQNTASAPQQANINSLPRNPNELQHFRQQLEQEMLLSRQMQQLQLLQRQSLQVKQMLQLQQQQQQHPQLLQQFQQQLPLPQKQHQTAQLQSHLNLMQQLPQMDEDLKMRLGMSFKPGMAQQNHSAGQHAYNHQPLKPGSQFPVSPQLFQAVSPQIFQHASPQIDEQNLLSLFSKAGTPLQSANSSFILPSPFTPLSPSPMLGDPEKQASGISMISNAVNVGQAQVTSASNQVQSLAIGTPGISASTLLAEFTSPDGNQGTASIIISGKPNATEQRMECLVKALTGDINDEVESRNCMLHRMGNEMDASRGIDSGTMDRFKMVFEKKSSRRMFTIVATFVVVFLVVYYLKK